MSAFILLLVFTNSALPSKLSDLLSFHFHLNPILNLWSKVQVMHVSLQIPMKPDWHHLPNWEILPEPLVKPDTAPSRSPLGEKTSQMGETNTTLYMILLDYRDHHVTCLHTFVYFTVCFSACTSQCCPYH